MYSATADDEVAINDVAAVEENIRPMREKIFSLFVPKNQSLESRPNLISPKAGPQQFSGGQCDRNYDKPAHSNFQSLSD